MDTGRMFFDQCIFNPLPLFMPNRVKFNVTQMHKSSYTCESSFLSVF